MDLVPPFWSTLDREAVPDIYPDMPLYPYRRAGDDPGEIGGDLLANFNHAVRRDVRASSRRKSRRGRECCASVSFGGVPTPAPQNPLYEVHAIKAECIGGGGVDPRLLGLACIVGVIFCISRLVLRRHRGPKAPHNIECLIVPRHGEELVHKHAGGHEAGGIRRGVSVKVGFPVSGAAGPGGLPLVRGPLKLEEDGVGGGADVLGAFQRGEDALVAPGELLE